MKYPEVVADAREAAKATGMCQIVFETQTTWWQYRHYNSCNEWAFYQLLKYATVPRIRLLKCMPDGAVVQ